MPHVPAISVGEWLERVVSWICRQSSELPSRNSRVTPRRSRVVLRRNNFAAKSQTKSPPDTGATFQTPQVESEVEAKCPGTAALHSTHRPRAWSHRTRPRRRPPPPPSPPARTMHRGVASESAAPSAAWSMTAQTAGERRAPTATSTQAVRRAMRMATSHGTSQA